MSPKATRLWRGSTSSPRTVSASTSNYGSCLSFSGRIRHDWPNAAKQVSIGQPQSLIGVSWSPKATNHAWSGCSRLPIMYPLPGRSFLEGLASRQGESPMETGEGREDLLPFADENTSLIYANNVKDQNLLPNLQTILTIGFTI